jgi:hypothetical protein
VILNSECCAPLLCCSWGCDAGVGRKGQNFGRGDRLLDVAEMAAKVIVAPLITLFGTVIPVGLLVWVRVLGKPAAEW